VPFCNEATRTERAVPATRTTCPDEARTTYSVIGEFPSLAGAFHARSMEESPAVADMKEGASGTLKTATAVGQCCAAISLG